MKPAGPLPPLNKLHRLTCGESELSDVRLTGHSGLTCSICLDGLRTVVSALEGDGAKTRVAKSHEAGERERGGGATSPGTACLREEANEWEYYANERLPPRY